MKAVKKLSDYLALPAWKLLYDKHVNKYLKNIIQETDTRPYKVYTALLTQSGGDNIQFIYNGELTIGITYVINVNDVGGDFTNVGAPNNNVGTSFVATGTTPNSWGNNIDVELQYNTGAPVVTVLENTIGNIWFTYNSVGSYFANSDGLFTTYKRHSLNDQTCGLNYGDQIFFLFLNATSNNEYEFPIITTDFSLNPIDGALTSKLIEIRVYN